MIAGSVNAFLEAEIPLTLQASDGRGIGIKALVDTGFTGSLTLPPAMIEELRLEWVCREEGVLGDGSTRLFEVYVATVLWDSQPKLVEVNAAETDPLVGMALLHGHRLQVDAVAGGRVTITPLGED
jgi:clan AA aspartic protease